MTYMYMYVPGKLHVYMYIHNYTSMYMYVYMYVEKYARFPIPCSCRVGTYIKEFE